MPDCGETASKVPARRLNTNETQVMHSTGRFFRIPLALTLTVALLLGGVSARANVYATNIKLNGALANASVSQGSSVTISYILNEPATSGVTINILSSTNVVRSISIDAGNAGTLRGTNSVIWDGTDNSQTVVAGGKYSVSITAAATGYSDWTQTTQDTNIGNTASFPWGIDVDKNTNSPYYGRVVMSCANANPSTTNGTGLFKMNADGSFADEGWYGYANYSTNDGGNVLAGQMGPSGWHCPEMIRIGEDDRIYVMDNSAVGAIIACDILATTNQLVIDEGTYTDPYGNHSVWGGPNNYGQCPLINDLSVNGWGIRQFDVCGLGTSNAAIYLVDTGDNPNWGIWCFRFDTNGAGFSDTNETQGCQVIYAGNDPDVTGGGVMVDYNMNIFFSSAHVSSADPGQRTFLWTNWAGGTLPPENSTFDTAFGNGGQPATWEVGSTDPYMTGIADTVINSRAYPTLVAVAMAQGDAVPGGHGGQNGGIRILSAVDGSVVKTNLDIANWYVTCAFDAVGNVYGCTWSANLWRAWSPPGANQATTKAVFSINVAGPFKVTSSNVSNGIVTINFSGPSNDPTAFKLVGSSTVNGTYSQVIGSIITGSNGSFTATATALGATQFYQIQM